MIRILTRDRGRALFRPCLMAMAVLHLSLAGCSRAEPERNAADDKRIDRAFEKMEAEQARTDCAAASKRRQGAGAPIGPADTVAACAS
jgi:hypothetical protein